MNITYLKGALLILAATFCFAFQPIFGTFAYDDGTGVVALLWLRFSFAVLLLHGYRLCRAASRSSVSARNPLLLGIVLALTSVCYFSALRYISIGLTTLLFYLFPLYIYLLSIALRRERFSAVKTAAIAVALGGVYIGAGDLGSLPLLGLVLGLSAGA
ncbi:MAG: EamA family transporter, partial [Pseudomonadales bacterium]